MRLRDTFGYAPHRFSPTTNNFPFCQPPLQLAIIGLYLHVVVFRPSSTSTSQKGNDEEQDLVSQAYGHRRPPFRHPRGGDRQDRRGVHHAPRRHRQPQAIVSNQFVRFISGVQWYDAQNTQYIMRMLPLSAGARCSATRLPRGRWGGAWRCRGSGGCTGGTRPGSYRCSGGARPAATPTPPTSSDW